MKQISPTGSVEVSPLCRLELGPDVQRKQQRVLTPCAPISSSIFMGWKAHRDMHMEYVPRIVHKLL